MSDKKVLKKILLFTYGDANKAASWSNVPLMLKRALENKNIDVINLDISPDDKWNKWWLKHVFWKINRIFPNHQYSYIRTYINKYLTEKKIKFFIQLHKDADYCVFLNYDYYNKFSKTPTLLMGDWTYDIVILDRLNRKPYFFEKWFSNYQKKAINSADIVISLFKDCADAIRERSQNKHIYHLGINGVNDMSLVKYSENQIIQQKARSKSFLFIGSPKYLPAAQLLAKTFMILKEQFKDIELNIIGITLEQLQIQDSKIHCWGYLNKDKELDNVKYYELMVGARCLVNPSAVWAGYSSTIEAMYYYTPIITTPYDAFTLDFGKEIDFGFYLEHLDQTELSEKLKLILETSDYEEMCTNAHAHVKDFTWDIYVDKMLSLMMLHGK